jgi:hypothetical protein
MVRHSGSARDPLNVEKSSQSSTPGMGWVIGGLVVICLLVAAADMSGGWLQNSIAHVAGSVSGQG